MSLEQYLEMGNTTMEQLRDHAREQAAAAARYELAVGGIASPLLGVLGDGVGLVPVIWILVACAAAGLVFSLGVLANESRFRCLK